MCDSIQNIIQEYNQRLQNTWHSSERKQGGIPCPSQQLKDFLWSLFPGSVISL